MSDECIEIYAHIDTILDVRTGAMVSLHPSHNVVGELLKNGYLDRVTDTFSEYSPKVNTEDVKKLIGKQNNSTLRCSMMSKILFFVKDIATVIEDTNSKSPLTREYKFVLDVDKYPLSEAEIDGLKAVIVAYLPTFTFSVERIGLEKLRPSYISGRFTALFIYDLENWFKLHGEDLPKTPIPDVNLFAPALFYDRVPTEEETIVEGLGPTSPFYVFEKVLVEFIKLQLIDVKHFSFYQE